MHLPGLADQSLGRDGQTTPICPNAGLDSHTTTQSQGSPVCFAVLRLAKYSAWWYIKEFALGDWPCFCLVAMARRPWQRGRRSSPTMARVTCSFTVRWLFSLLLSGPLPWAGHRARSGPDRPRPVRPSQSGTRHPGAAHVFFQASAPASVNRCSASPSDVFDDSTDFCFCYPAFVFPVSGQVPHCRLPSCPSRRSFRLPGVHR